MYRKLEHTRENRNNERQGIEMPFDFYFYSVSVSGSMDKLTVNEVINYMTSAKLDFSMLEIYRGEEKQEIDYSKSYQEVVKMLNAEVNQIEYFRNKIVSKIKNDKNEIATVSEFQTYKIVVNLEKTW